MDTVAMGSKIRSRRPKRLGGVTLSEVEGPSYWCDGSRIFEVGAPPRSRARFARDDKLRLLCSFRVGIAHRAPCRLSSWNFARFLTSWECFHPAPPLVGWNSTNRHALRRLTSGIPDRQIGSLIYRRLRFQAGDEG